MPSWLHIEQGEAPLVVSIPHAGQELLPEMERQVASAWLARKDTDWYVDQLYDFAPSLGATVVRTSMSRSVIDVNRDPSANRCTPARTRPNFVPPQPLTVSRYTARATIRIQRKFRDAGEHFSIRITLRLARNSSG